MAKKHDRSPSSHPWRSSHSVASAAGVFFLVYFAAMIAVRYHLRGPIGLADSVWGCNVAILLAGVGMLARSRAVVGTAVCVVAFPHFMWWVDVAAWLATGSFPLGTAEYISWDATPRLELATTTHHVWFIPLCHALLRGNGGMPWRSWPRAFCVTAVIGAMGLLFPKEVILPDGTPFYLNVNMAHEFWADIKGGPLDNMHVCDPPKCSLAAYQLFLNVVGLVANAPLQLTNVAVSRAMEPATAAKRKRH